MANLTVVIALLIIAITATAATAASPPAETKYTNHTVGGAIGWFFNATTNTSFTNYSSWAASETFNLGDFLIFNTITNQTVIETYNETTYRSCSIDDSSDDTYEYSGGNDQFGESQTIFVPLTLEGPTYYFSSAGDGVQCQHGMAFGIQVNYGLGLPPVLNESPGPVSALSPPGSVAGAPPARNGGFRTGGSVRGGLFALFALMVFLLMV